MEIDFNLLAMSIITYGVGAGCPGPSTLLISNTAMANGRKRGLAMAFGVVVGSLFWGVMAACGLSFILATFGKVAGALRIIAALYFFYLSLRSIRALVQGRNQATQTRSSRAFFAEFQRGVLLHVTNPKAVFVWLATISIGMPLGQNHQLLPFVIVSSCGFLGLLIFSSYALVFSTNFAQNLYQSLKRWIEGFSAGVFASAGIYLLLKHEH